jgi:arylsulfatase A-like enzyme
MRRPSILLIVADDVGYADLSCCGQTDFAKPHLTGW